MARTILIVEDNSDNRSIYATLLRHHGYRVLEAEDGAEGLELARTELPDLVLMDISLPVLDGWQATELLKQDSQTASIPVIALTAHAMVEHRHRSLDAGCAVYLAKPCEPSRVLEEIGRLLAAPAGA